MNQVLTSLKNTENSEYGSATPTLYSKPHGSHTITGSDNDTASHSISAENDSDGPYEPIDTDDYPVAGIKSATRETTPANYAWPINYLGTT